MRGSNMLELKGKAVADSYKTAIIEKVEALKEKNIILTLAILLVGDDMAAKMYAKFMEKKALEVGFGVEVKALAETASQEEVEAAIQYCNESNHIYGVLPLMPMPKHIDASRVIEKLSPQKDLDGLTTYNIGLVTSSKGGFAPCTPRACMAILDYYGIDISGKHVVVVGRSQVVGKPVALLALERHATVTICHSKTQNLAEELGRADVIVAAAGRAHMIDGSMVKPGAVVIDVGINELDGKTVGDVDYASLRDDVYGATPVPGGVGSVTTTMMLQGLCEAYDARNVNC